MAIEEIVIHFKNPQGKVIATRVHSIKIDGRGKMAGPVPDTVKGVKGNRVIVPRCCGNCLYHIPDFSQNRQIYGEIDYPYCPIQEQQTDNDGYCASHAFVDRILQYPEEWGG